MNPTLSWLIRHDLLVISLETLVKQLCTCATDLHCMRWNIHDPAVLCDICKCVRSKCQFGESSWVLQRTPSSLTCGNVVKLHLFMWTLETHSCPPALETKDVELPRGEWPGGQTHAYQLDLTPARTHCWPGPEQFLIYSSFTSQWVRKMGFCGRGLWFYVFT